MLRLGAYHDLIKRFLHKASKRQVTQYNNDRSDHDFKVGDSVMRKDHPLSNAGNYFSAKLAKTFSGPYKIVRQLSKNVFELQLPDKKQSPKVHVRYLKHFVPVSDTCTAMSENSDSENENDSFFPPIPYGCFNCGENHDHRKCPLPKMTPFCYMCGWWRKTKYTCPRPSCRIRFQSSWSNQRQIRTSPPRSTHSGLDLCTEARPEAGPTCSSVPPPGSPVRPPSPQPSTSRGPPLQAYLPEVTLRQLTVSSSSSDPVSGELHEILRNFFFRRGLNISSSTPVQVSAYISTADQVFEFEPNHQEVDEALTPMICTNPIPADGNDVDQDLIDLHPTVDDVVVEEGVPEDLNLPLHEDSIASDADTEFDVGQEVQKFESRGTYPFSDIFSTSLFSLISLF